MPIWRRLLVHLVRFAASRTICIAGSSRPSSTAMMAMTTSSSMRVNADGRRRDEEGEGMETNPFCRAGQKRVATALEARQDLAGTDGFLACSDAQGPKHRNIDSAGRSSGL